MLRKMILSVACVLMATASAQAVPTTLFEDTASSDFGNSTQSLDNADFFSGSASWQVDYPGQWNTAAFKLQDAQTTINDLINNDLSLYYKTDTPGQVNFQIKWFNGAGHDNLTDQVNLDLTADGQWHELLIDFSDAGSGLDPNAPREATLFTQNWVGSSARTVNYDLVTVTPEPASLALLGLGGLVMLRRRRA